MNTPTWTKVIEGYRTKTITRGNVTVVVHRPELTDKERLKRESQVETALSSYAKSLSQRKASNT